MLIKINNIPLNLDTFARGYIGTSDGFTAAVTEPLTVGFHIGELQVESADLNPVNIPEQIASGIGHLIDWIF